MLWNPVIQYYYIPARKADTKEGGVRLIQWSVSAFVSKTARTDILNRSQQFLWDFKSSSALLFLIWSRWQHQDMGDCKPKPDQNPSAIDNITIKHIKTCQTLPIVHIALLKPILTSTNPATRLSPAAPALPMLGPFWVKNYRIESLNGAWTSTQAA